MSMSQPGQRHDGAQNGPQGPLPALPSGMDDAGRTGEKDHDADIFIAPAGAEAHKGQKKSLTAPQAQAGIIQQKAKRNQKGQRKKAGPAVISRAGAPEDGLTKIGNEKPEKHEQQHRMLPAGLLAP